MGNSLPSIRKRDGMAQRMRRTHCFLIQFEPDQHDWRLDRHSLKLRVRQKVHSSRLQDAESKVKLTDSLRDADALAARPEADSVDCGTTEGTPTTNLIRPRNSVSVRMAVGDSREARLVLADGREFAVIVTSREDGLDWSELEVRSPAFTSPGQSAKTYSLRHERRRRGK
jgi:hypothetical protein